MGDVIRFPVRTALAGGVADGGDEYETALFWERLRVALADELIAKLPVHVPLVSVAKLLRVSEAAVLKAVCDADVVTETVGGVVCMNTRLSTDFIRREWRTRLPLPKPAAVARAGR